MASQAADLSLPADLGRASLMIELGRNADATRLLAAILATVPDSSRGWCLLARARLGAAEFPAAVQAATRASSLDPADDWPHRLASTGLLGAGQTADAVTAALEARRLAPHFWRSQLCLAQAAVADGRLDLAAEAAATALAIAPGQADVHITAGRVALVRGDAAEARRRQESALAIEPAHSSAINELGRISLRCRDLTGAAEYFLRAARMAPGTGVFGRNSELALRRLALWLAAPLLLAAACCAAAAALELAGRPAGAALLAVAAWLGLAWMALRLRTVPPAVRAALVRLSARRWRRSPRNPPSNVGAGGNAPATGQPQ